MSRTTTTLLIAMVRAASWIATSIAIVVSVVTFPFVGSLYFLREWWRGE